MSIAPPSDIVFDVAQAADPLKLQAATAKLARMAAGAGAAGPDFGAALQASARRQSPPGAAGPSSTLWRGAPGAQAKPASTYQKFEAVVLQNFMQNILPKDENLFGDAASADIVRTMMAEQLATQLAKSGRVGIAQMIERAHSGDHKAQPAAPRADAAPPAPQARIDPVAEALDAALRSPTADAD